ncbi:OLC1v1026676C1 [Oldenlandia corymbosa var. corymbosa]|uniref:Glycosyltransferase n=1 Tax=Oldenlandia corymbosa var. corymbosa TaxID=529605 RepID=A0AAV1C7K7_OLDCO|nr:OLC1v1026676C1 [Oldenlandia corymbosa var. corymbosa]
MDNHHHQNPSEVLLTTHPHVLFFPLPLQGPVNCLLKLAEIFCLHRIQVTFLNTDYIHRRLLRYSDISTRFNRYGELFRFRTVSDGLREDSLRTSEQIGELLESMESSSLPVFREMVRSSVFRLGGGGAGGAAYDDDRDGNPISCIIADGAFGFAADVAGEFGVSIFYFDTISPCAQWAILNARRLKEGGDYPFKDDGMDAPVTSLPGMEGFLRRRDLPSFFRNSDQSDPIIQRLMSVESPMRRAHGLIFNSFVDLEGPTLSQLQTLTPKVYAIGPLHTHHKTRLSSDHHQNQESIGNSTNSLWKENKDCISWLDKQPAKSVIYVSIGSLAVMGNEQFMEIWHGIVNSGVRFLWVRRPGSVAGLGQENGESSEIHRDLELATKERGYIVSWAPQEEVLAHPAVGGFFTHSGWNSTLESIVEGVPMICWPYYADQQMNSRYVGEVWKVGLDMKDTCDRGIVEMMIREIMEDGKNEILGRVEDMAKLAKACVNKGGSSYHDLNRLVEDIKSTTPRRHNRCL